MAAKKKDPCPAGQYWNGKKCVTGQDPYKYKNKMVDTGAYYDEKSETYDSKKYYEDRKSDEINTNRKDKVFYDSMGPVAPGMTRAKFKPSFPNRLEEGDPDRYQKKGGSVRTKKTKMAMGGTKKTVIKKPLKTAMYGTAMKPVKTKMAMGGSTTKLKKSMYGSTMKPTMMAKPSIMKKGGTKKK